MDEIIQKNCRKKFRSEKFRPNDFYFNFEYSNNNDDDTKYDTDNEDEDVEIINQDEIQNSLIDDNGDNEQHFQSSIEYFNIPHGLINIGNSCYINSVLQTMFSFNDFMDKIIDFTYQLQNDKKNLLITRSFLEVYNEYLCGSPEIANCLRNFNFNFQTKNINFQTDRQQDAGEYFALLLNTIKQEIFLNASTNYNPIDDYFQYELSFRDVCCNCNQSYTNMENEKSHIILLKYQNDIQNSFLNFLQDDSPRKCSNCKENFCRKVYFQKLPKILCFQIGRYSANNVKDDRDVFASPYIYLPKTNINSGDIDKTPNRKRYFHSRCQFLFYFYFQSI